ncbi:MAG: hypothetical protein LBE92_14390 [Chryseobacterium sp.]|jgi:hypothetical protein|uniref:hypothetical protein n=1 Tax=Chryseobacterium sp. TaxID=1871047 RepID=UPI002831294A|nr:hypothetical protein [Chryseobacterium sp.]MDR2237308.1 hypothetical protein [Chryseobacterium sp.]
MRALTLIFMVLAFIVGGFLSVFQFKCIENRMGTDGDPQKLDQVYTLVENAQKEIDELKKQGVDVTKIDDSQIQQSLDTIAKTPPRWKVEYAGKLGILLAVLAFAMVVVAFMKKEMVNKLAVAVIVLALVVWFSAPDIAAGKYSGANPKTIALIAFAALAVSSACAMMSYKLYLKKSKITA